MNRCIRTALHLTFLVVAGCWAGCSKAPSADRMTSQGRAVSPAASGIASPTGGTDWPGFLGPSRNGKSAEKGVPERWPAKGPPVLWQKEIGVGYSAPAISQGRVFHFARFDDVERLTCMDALTGKTLWTRDYETDYSDMLGYNNGPRATPVVD